MYIIVCLEMFFKHVYETVNQVCCEFVLNGFKKVWKHLNSTRKHNIRISRGPQIKNTGPKSWGIVLGIIKNWKTLKNIEKIFVKFISRLDI